MYVGEVPHESASGGVIGLGENPDRMAGLAGDLLVIEGLDQAEEPRETDYLPEYTIWTRKPFTGIYDAYRKGPRYWGQGVQRIPGFEGRYNPKSIRFNQGASSRYTEGLGLHEPDEQRHALSRADAAFRHGWRAVGQRDRAEWAHALGYLRAIRDLAAHEEALMVHDAVQRMVNDLKKHADRLGWRA